MIPTTSQPEGSNRSGDPCVDLIAANFPDRIAVNHWACGMPLSHVREMAHHWLAQLDQSARVSHLLDPAADYDRASATDTK
jgi:hypothetical protein